jgi:hypothetical protein
VGLEKSFGADVLRVESVLDRILEMALYRSRNLPVFGSLTEC